MYAWVVLSLSAPVITFGDAFQSHTISPPAGAEQRQEGRDDSHSYFFLSVMSKAEVFAGKQTFEIL